MDSVYYNIIYFCKNIIQAYKNYFALNAGLINLLLEIFDIIKNFYTFIINNKTVYKLSFTKNYI